MRLTLLVPAILPFLTACAAMPTAAGKAQETAQDLNLDTRFGRMELAVEKVAEREREAWLKRHKSWGGAIRIADTEIGGVRMRSQTEAVVTVRIAWYRLEEQELRMTALKQTYKDVDGVWRLAGETRTDGDLGLLGEPAPPPAPAVAQVKRAYYPTVRIGADQD
jgi:hypothetical protein